MREQLLDIISHTHDLKILDKVLMTTNDDETIIQSVDDGKNMVVKGKLKNRIDEFKGQFGMSNLETLKGYCNFAMFKADDANITVKRKKSGSEEFPEEFIFSGNSVKSNYRCMMSSAVPPQPNFKGSSDWDVDIIIPKGKITEFAQMSSILKLEKYMHVELKDGDLKFYIGAPNSTENHAVVTVAEDIDGSLKNVFEWEISHFLSIARLTNGDLPFRMLNKGLINILVDSEYGEYEYYLPRRVVENTDN